MMDKFLYPYIRPRMGRPCGCQHNPCSLKTLDCCFNYPLVLIWLLKFDRTQWIFLLYRWLQKIEQVKPDHCDRYQNNRNKNCNWMALVSYIGNCGNISQISLKCRKSLNLVKLLKSWQFIISLKTFGGLINYFK